MSAPASTMPMSNLAVAASDLALGQSVRYRHQHRYRLYNYYSGPYYGYGGDGPRGGDAELSSLLPTSPTSIDAVCLDGGEGEDLFDHHPLSRPAQPRSTRPTPQRSI